MKKIFIVMSVLIAWTASLSAENITRKQADKIALDYLQNELTQPFLLFVNVNAPNEEGIVITTYQGEKIKAKYACWTYCVSQKLISKPPWAPPAWMPTLYRYLFVKEDNGSLLEIITENNFVTEDFIGSWEAVDMPTGLLGEKDNHVKQLYPNPINDWLTFPCNDEPVRVEIYDLKGTRLFSGLLSGKGSCQLNVSFLETGVYMVNVSGETYKIIKN